LLEVLGTLYWTTGIRKRTLEHQGCLGGAAF
jgi:hypothetical protein